MRQNVQMIDDFAAYPEAGQKTIKKQVPHFSKLPIFERCHLFLSERFCFCLATNLHIFFFETFSAGFSHSPKSYGQFRLHPPWHLNMVASKFRISFSSGKISRAAMLDFRVDMLMNGRRHRPKFLVVWSTPPQLPLPPTSPPMPDNLSINSPPTKLPFFNLKMTAPKMKESGLSSSTKQPPWLGVQNQLFSPSTFVPKHLPSPEPPLRYLWISVWSNYSDLLTTSPQKVAFLEGKWVSGFFHKNHRGGWNMNSSIWPVSVDIPHKNHHQHKNKNGLSKGALDISTKWLKSSIPEVFRHPTSRGKRRWGWQKCLSKKYVKYDIIP